MSDRQTIALIGTGQLGGSFALALLQAGVDAQIVGYDTDAAQSALLHERGALTRVATSVADAVTGADVVVLATPLRSYRAIAEAMLPHLGGHTIITDLGSTQCTLDTLRNLLPATRVVPAHPIAGGEGAGAAVAREDLFTKRLAIISAHEDVPTPIVEAVEGLWHAVGAVVLNMPVEVHDQIYAHVSHLPHYIAFAAAEVLFQSGVKLDLADETLQKFLRISRSNPRMWTDIALENREALLPVISTYAVLLEHFSTELLSGKSEGDADAQLAAQRFYPRILASALISTVHFFEQQAGLSLREFGAGGMRDIVAPAAIDPEAELEKMSQSAPAIAALLQQTVPLFKKLETLIGAEDAPALFDLLSAWVSHAHVLVSLRQ